MDDMTAEQAQVWADQLTEAHRNPKPRTSIIISDLSGREVARMKVGQSYRGFVVESIGEIHVNGNPPLPDMRMWSGTYRLVLKGAGGVQVIIIDAQDPLFVLTLSALARTLPKVLHYNDNTAQFDTF